jgi:hypothetical protein
VQALIKYELIINLRTAKSLDHEASSRPMPESMLRVHHSPAGLK